MLKTDTKEVDEFLDEVKETYDEKVSARVKQIIDQRKNPVFVPELVLMAALRELEDPSVRALNTSLALKFMT